MDANSREPWSEADIGDLKNEIEPAGRLRRLRASFAGTCTRCARRMKLAALTEQPGKPICGHRPLGAGRLRPPTERRPTVCFARSGRPDRAIGWQARRTRA